MREFKFRAWDSKLEHGMISNYEDSIFVESYTFNNERFIAMQFTGLLDKNGKEIYEGDFLLGGCSGTQIPTLVEFTSTKKLIGMSDGFIRNTIGFVIDEYYFSLDKCEVIGNIYENPELLDANK